MTGSYKLASFEIAGETRAGILVGDRLYDAAALTGMQADATVLGILEDWAAADARLGAAADRAPDSGARSYPRDKMRLRAPVLWPSAIYCAGSNYADHSAEMTRANNLAPEPDPRALGLKPWHFLKAARSSVSDPGAVVRTSHYSTMMDWEIELVAVIGPAAKDVSIENALAHVAGYTIANDLSARDRRRRPHVSDTSPFKADWIAHKSFDGSCPVGPWIAPAKDIGDPQALKLTLSVNGAVKQDSSTSKMIFSVAEQIAHLSASVTLQPGDLILTGTPAGVGAARQEFLQPGDAVTLSIEGIGTLAHSIC